MKGLHSGVFFLARNFITILLFVTGSKVNHLQINGFKIDTKNGQRKSIKFMFRFAGRKILHLPMYELQQPASISNKLTFPTKISAR